MKRFVILILAMAISATLFSEYVVADNIPVTTENEECVIVLDTPKQPGNRPKMPSRQFITCYYDGESLNLDFAYSEGECEVCVTDITTNFSRFYYIDSSELLSTIYVGEINSSIITVTTSHGHIYTGELYLE